MRPWVVVALLVAGNAHAQHSESECFEDVWLPARGATDVPTNTKLWHIGPRVIDIDREELTNAAPNTDYRPHHNTWSFRTGPARDDTPPIRPTITRISISVDRPISLERIERHLRDRLEANSPVGQLTN